jgi:seryl-tRNA(Sec) selenium transferase
MRSFLSRRNLLKGAGAGWLLETFLPRQVYAEYLAAGHGELYREIGIRPFINAAGTYTVLSGAVIPDRVRETMAEASRYFVPLVPLQNAVGERIAKMIGVEGALVTSGATGSILLATAACVTGKDPEKVRRLPDLTSMKNEVIIPRAQRNGYNHAARSVGVRIVEVETIEQLKSAINSKTAMLYWTNIMEWMGKITRHEFVEAGKAASIPLFNDAAAELPPAENLAGLVREGFDLVGFSGGKGLRGLQSTGLLLGRKDLIEAAQLNNNPHDDAVGRTCKVGKEELMGTLAAVEVFVNRDHEADLRTWRGYMESIAKDLSGIDTVRTKIYIPIPGGGPGGGHPIPYLRVQWDESKLKLNYQDCSKLLKDGEPSIEVNASRQDGLDLASYNLFPGEERIVGQRLRKILKSAAKQAPTPAA